MTELTATSSRANNSSAERERRARAQAEKHEHQPSNRISSDAHLHAAPEAASPVLECVEAPTTVAAPPGDRDEVVAEPELSPTEAALQDPTTRGCVEVLSGLADPYSNVRLAGHWVAEIAPDPRHFLEQLVLTEGLEKAEAFMETARAEKRVLRDIIETTQRLEGEASLGTSHAQKIQDARRAKEAMLQPLETAWREIGPDAKAFLADYTALVATVANDMLNLSEIRARSEQARYGLTVTEMPLSYAATVGGTQFLSSLKPTRVASMADTKETQGLARTAKQLLDHGYDPSKSATAEATDAHRDTNADAAQNTMDRCCAALIQRHPVLGGLASIDLAVIAQGPSVQAAAILDRQINVTLENIETTRARLERDPEAALGFPPAVAAASLRTGVLDSAFKERLAHNAVQKVAEDRASTDRGILLAGLGLTVASAILTGGASLAISFAIVALDIGSAARSLNNYSKDEAAFHTDLIPQDAVSDIPGDHIGLILDLATLGLDAVSLAKSLKAAGVATETLRPLNKALRTADAAKRIAIRELKGLLKGAAKALTPELYDSVVELARLSAEGLHSAAGTLRTQLLKAVPEAALNNAELFLRASSGNLLRTALKIGKAMNSAQILALARTFGPSVLEAIFSDASAEEGLAFIGHHSPEILRDMAPPMTGARLIELEKGLGVETFRRLLSDKGRNVFRINALAERLGTARLKSLAARHGLTAIEAQERDLGTERLRAFMDCGVPIEWPEGPALYDVRYSARHDRIFA